MSTRCNIAYLDRFTGKVSSIYCHYDGYPDGVGETLNEFYSTDSAARALIALGDISSLRKYHAPRLDQPHSFVTPAPDVTIAYTRDRGENTPASTHDGIVEWLCDTLANYGYEYLYLSHGGGWTTIDASVARTAFRAKLSD
jgi:hypothetical protein